MLQLPLLSLIPHGHRGFDLGCSGCARGMDSMLPDDIIMSMADPSSVGHANLPPTYGQTATTANDM